MSVNAFGNTPTYEMINILHSKFFSLEQVFTSGIDDSMRKQK